MRNEFPSNNSLGASSCGSFLFSGDDDGTFQAAELTEFAYRVASTMPHPGLVYVIGPHHDPWECPGCSLESFEYTPGGTLEFVAHAQGSIGFNETVTNTGFLGSWYGEPWTLTTTPDSIISVSAVPEPGSKFMFMAGLLGLAYLSKRNTARR